MSEIQPIIEIESYANVLRRPVETAKKTRVFTKDNLQNVLDDRSLDFTKNISNINSNTCDHVPGTSGNINFSDLFKALKEDDKKVIVEQKRQWNLPLPLGKLIHREMIHLDEELVNILQSFETKKIPKKVAKVINEMLEIISVLSPCLTLAKKF